MGVGSVGCAWCRTDHYPVGDAHSEDREDVRDHARSELSPQERQEHGHGEIHTGRIVVIVAGENHSWRRSEHTGELWLDLDASVATHAEKKKKKDSPAFSKQAGFLANLLTVSVQN